jgi:hypothetical protein
MQKLLTRRITSMLLGIVLLLAVAFIAPPVTHAQAHMPASYADGELAAFTHTANASNSSGDYTLLDNPNSNGNPNAILSVTQNWNGSRTGGVYNNHNIGVWYTGSRWAIFNQDGAAIPSGAQFNVAVYSAGSNAYVHQAMASNTSANSTYLDNSLLNGNSSAMVLVTAVYGSTHTYNNHPVGVWYTGSHWVVFNEDRATMPTGATFNILLGPLPDSVIPNGYFYVHHATSANTFGDYTILSDGFSDDQLGAMVFETHNWGSAGIYNNHPTGVWYTSANWSIFNEDIATMPTGLDFNVQVNHHLREVGPTFCMCRDMLRSSTNWLKPWLPLNLVHHRHHHQPGPTGSFTTAGL